MGTGSSRLLRMVPASLLMVLAAGCAKRTGDVAPTAEEVPSAAIREQLSGTWVMTDESTYSAWVACCEGPDTDVPFTPEFRKIRDAFATIPSFPAKDKPTLNNLANCVTAGVPGTIEHPLMFEFLLTPGRANVIFMDGSFRRIWTDGRGFPETFIYDYQGYTIGRWEGNTLIAETQGISPRADMFIDGGIKTTKQTKVTERITVESEKSLRMTITVEDPTVFAQPYTYKRDFIKVPLSFEVGCAAENRDTGSEVDLTPPADDE
ncbi:hypothetical protein [Steroidobacter sp.]|uniref:hypothetical protein n=1 Tax=Steroidobacter sp. TaxID=1978227 RepID=UPI001A4DDC37|nr:hypothetical protein [Steroidobacter sp.]MBL8269537.1 hypothetical protein [Steroidobacter sp.]